MDLHAGRYGRGVVQQGLEGLGAQEVLEVLEGPCLQGCLQLLSGQGALGVPVDLVGLSSSLGPDCLPWDQWAQAASKYQLCPAGLHLQGCPGQLGNPKAGQCP